MSSILPQEVRNFSRGAATLIALCLGIHMLFIGLGELIPEESYYWQFSRHLDWSYLDHPVMVALLIKFGTATLGHNCFGVRIGALLCGLATAFFVYRTAERLFSKETARSALLLYAALPYFFLSAHIITPDAPLILCWSAMHYFLLRIFLDNQGKAWAAAGLALGLGMLSKYSIALNVISAFAFMLFYQPARKWFFSPWPYIAALIASIVSLPVLYWNSQHEWASFAFQTSRRLEEAPRFGLHIFLISIVALVLPSGFLALFKIGQDLASKRQRSELENFRRVFLLCFLALPCAVFFIFSLRHVPKINWAGPALLIALPFFAEQIIRAYAQTQGFARSLASSWSPSIKVLLVLYVLALTYYTAALPVFPYSKHSQRFIGWTDLGQKVFRLAQAMQAKDGSDPVIVGMDKHTIASELAFYTRAAQGSTPLPSQRFAGRSIFGLNALMYHFWQPPDLAGKNLLLIARNKSDLEFPEIASHLQSKSEIGEIETRVHSQPAGKFFFLEGHSYISGSNHQQTNSDSSED